MMSNLKIKKISKRLLLFSALAIGMAILWFTNSLVEDLRREERIKVKIWAAATEQTTDIDNLDEDISFVFEVINLNKTIPVILTNGKGKILYHKNFPEKKALHSDYLADQLLSMQNAQDPITFEYADGKSNMIYYKDSILLTRLQYFPFMILFAVGLFILLGYLTFSASRKSEQNKVWAGMAKETAHQLGTPLTSLMGWLVLLKDKDGMEELAFEMNKDLLRLQTISERFSKIGSQPELYQTDLNKTLERSFFYMKDRSSSKIEFVLRPDSPSLLIDLNPQLFGWVIENILRNSIDAIQGEGSIHLYIKEQGNRVFVDIKDTGRGLRSAHMKTVFEPGYTTKKRGWGLGLSLVKRIIEDYHKGQVFVLQSELGKGTTFRISLVKS
jgi:signal transduction histidine kinase